MRIAGPSQEFEEARSLFIKNMNNGIHELTEKSGLDIEKYQSLYSRYQKCVKDASDLKDNIALLHMQIALYVILSVVFPVLGIKMITGGMENLEYFHYLEIREVILSVLEIPAGICFCLSIVIFILRIVKNILPALSDKRILQKELDQKVYASETACREKIDLFLQQIPAVMVYQTIGRTLDGLTIDSYMDHQRVRSLTKFKADLFMKEKNISTLNVISGEFWNNPFFIRESYEHYMSVKTYDGKRTVTIEKWENGLNGEKVLKTEDLHLEAYLTKDYPDYRKKLKLVFASEQLPGLSFTHEAKPASMKNAASRKKLIDKNLAKLERLHKKQLKNPAVSSPITPMSNSEFEGLFAAFDRNDEQQFRKMFSPMTQQNIVDLLKSHDFGDTFNYKKDCMLTYIEPAEKMSWDMDTGIQRYDSLDYNEICRRIREYGLSSFDMMYKFFALNFCFPIYAGAIPSTEAEIKPASGASEYMAEVLANKIGAAAMLGRDTNIIVHAKLSERGLYSDSYRLDVFYFEEYTHVEAVPASNDSRYLVDVEWTEYVPRHEYLTLRIFTTDMTEGMVQKLSETEAFRQLCPGPYAYLQNLVGVIEKAGRPVMENALAQLLKNG